MATNLFLFCVLCLTLLASVLIIGCASSQPDLATPLEVSANPAVDRILAGSCYSCHSNEAKSWYAKLQPSRWFGNPALDDLNFSEWQNYGPERRKDARREIAKAVESGAMPPAGYLLLHPRARLQAQQIAAIQRWAAAQGAIPAH